MQHPPKVYYPLALLSVLPICTPGCRFCEGRLVLSRSTLLEKGIKCIINNAQYGLNMSGHNYVEEMKCTSFAQMLCAEQW